MKPDLEPDEKLTHALREWVVDAPLPSRFQETVWHRIARAETHPAPGSWADALRQFVESMVRPKVACSYVAVLLLIGIAAGAWRAQIDSNRLESALGARYLQTVDPYQAPASR